MQLRTLITSSFDELPDEFQSSGGGDDPGIFYKLHAQFDYTNTRPNVVIYVDKLESGEHLLMKLYSQSNPSSPPVFGYYHRIDPPEWATEDSPGEE